MAYLFSSESVSEGHPDKVADQISDTILDQLLAYDPHARVAVETLVTTGQVIIAGEVKSEEYVDLQTLARKAINRIGYTKSEYQFDGDQPRRRIELQRSRSCAEFGYGISKCFPR